MEAKLRLSGKPLNYSLRNLSFNSFYMTVVVRSPSLALIIDTSSPGDCSLDDISLMWLECSRRK